MPSAQETLVSYRDDGPITVGTVAKSTMLDGSVVARFGGEVLKQLQGRTGVHLLLDFAHVEYLSSAALSELIKINDYIVGSGGSMRVCGLTPDIYKVFQITRFDKAFDIHAGEAANQAVVRFKRALQISQEQDAWEKRPGN